MKTWNIADVRAYAIDPTGGTSWLDTTPMSSPMSAYPDYRASRSSWSLERGRRLYVEVESASGIVGAAVGDGGDAGCLIVERLLSRFLVGADPRDVARLWDQMFRTASFDHGREGIAIRAISVVDLALWDLLGRLRGEPVYKMIGGAVRDSIPAYHTGQRADQGKALGFPMAKVTLPHGAGDGRDGLERNVAMLTENRSSVGPGYRFAVDCWTGLDVGSAVELARAVAHIDLAWIEEPLHAEDLDGFRALRAAVPGARWTTGEHRATRYGFRQLIAERLVDAVQPDLRWCGGLTEALRIADLAAAFDVPVMPHHGGVYSYHFAATQTHVPYVEFLNTSERSDAIVPLTGPLFEGEPLPKDGRITLGEAPGFGLALKADARGALRRPFVRDATA
ncbi:MAG: enolase C-terminal domain-like protein [Alphaproteobacteria bacterium]